MIRLISIFLLSCFLFQSLGKILILANYTLNKEFITKNFCENKSKPKLNCEGKCHLKKQLDKEDKKDNSPLNNLKEILEIQLFSESKENSLFDLFMGGEYSFATFQVLKTASPSFSVFHPPTA